MIPIRNSATDANSVKFKKILINLVMSCVTYLLVIAILVFWHLTARRRITERSVGL